MIKEIHVNINNVRWEIHVNCWLWSWNSWISKHCFSWKIGIAQPFTLENENFPQNAIAIPSCLAVNCYLLFIFPATHVRLFREKKNARPTTRHCNLEKKGVMESYNHDRPHVLDRCRHINLIQTANDESHTIYRNITEAKAMDGLWCSTHISILFISF